MVASSRSGAVRLGHQSSNFAKKLHKVEALYFGAGTVGEKDAAEAASVCA